MKKMKAALVLPTLCVLVTQGIRADVVYTNVFNSNAGAPGTAAGSTDVSVDGWGAYIARADGSVTDESTRGPVLLAAESGGGDPYMFGVPKTDGVNTNPDATSFFFSTDFSGTISLSALTSMTVEQSFDGSATDSAKGRFAVQIGSDWYASLYEMTSTTENGTTWTVEQLSGIDFTDGNNWLNMTAVTGDPGVGDISLGSAVGGTLSGDVSQFGIYIEHGNSGDHARFDSFGVAAVPEPATMGLLAVFGGGLMLIRRAFRV